MNAPHPLSRVHRDILPPIGIPAPPVPWAQLRPRRRLLARLASALRMWLL